VLWDDVAISSTEQNCQRILRRRWLLLCRPISLVEQADCGEIFAVLDGVGSAPKGMAAAPEVCDGLVKFIDHTGSNPSDKDFLQSLLRQAN
jgi:hypothetical protein